MKPQNKFPGHRLLTAVFAAIVFLVVIDTIPGRAYARGMQVLIESANHGAKAGPRKSNAFKRRIESLADATAIKAVSLSRTGEAGTSILVQAQRIAVKETGPMATVAKFGEEYDSRRLSSPCIGMNRRKSDFGTFSRTIITLSS